MGLGFNFVMPKFVESEQVWKPFDTIVLNFPTGTSFPTEAACQEYCNEQNIVSFDENHNIVFSRSQWKNWKKVNELAIKLGYHEYEGIPYIDQALKKRSLPNLFTRLYVYCHKLGVISEKEYTEYYNLLSEEI